MDAIDNNSNSNSNVQDNIPSFPQCSSTSTLTSTSTSTSLKTEDAVESIVAFLRNEKRYMKLARSSFCKGQDVIMSKPNVNVNVNTIEDPMVHIHMHMKTSDYYHNQRLQSVYNTILTSSSAAASTSTASAACFKNNHFASRAAIVRFLYQVIDYFNEEREIIQIAMNYLDRYLSSIYTSDDNATAKADGVNDNDNDSTNNNKNANKNYGKDDAIDSDNTIVTSMSASTATATTTKSTIKSTATSRTTSTRATNAHYKDTATIGCGMNNNAEKGKKEGERSRKVNGDTNGDDKSPTTTVIGEAKESFHFGNDNADTSKTHLSHDLGIVVLCCLDLAMKMFSPFSGDVKRALYVEIIDEAMKEAIREESEQTDTDDMSSASTLASSSSSSASASTGSSLSSTSTSTSTLPPFQDIFTKIISTLTPEDVSHRLSTKYNGSKFESMRQLATNVYSVKDFTFVQNGILNSLEYYLYPPSSISFLDRFLGLLGNGNGKDNKQFGRVIHDDVIDLIHPVHTSVGEDKDRIIQITSNLTTGNITAIAKNATVNSTTATSTEDANFGPKKNQKMMDCNYSYDHYRLDRTELSNINQYAALQIELALFDTSLTTTKPSILAFCALQNAIIQHFSYSSGSTNTSTSGPKEEQSQSTVNHDHYNYNYHELISLMNVQQVLHWLHNAIGENILKIDFQMEKLQIMNTMLSLLKHWKRNNPDMVTFDDSIITTLFASSLGSSPLGPSPLSMSTSASETTLFLKRVGVSKTSTSGNGQFLTNYIFVPIVDECPHMIDEDDEEDNKPILAEIEQISSPLSSEVIRAMSGPLSEGTQGKEALNSDNVQIDTTSSTLNIAMNTINRKKRKVFQLDAEKTDGECASKKHSKYIFTSNGLRNIK